MGIREKLKALDDRRNAITAQIQEFAKAEQSRELTADELKTLEEISAELETLKVEIAATEKRMKSYEDSSRDADARPRGVRKTAPGQPGATEVSEPEFVKDKKKGFKTPREFCQAVIAATTERKRDERLEYLRTSRYESAAGSDDHGTFTDPHGGYFVPTGLLTGVLQVDPEPDPISGRTLIVPMGSPKVSINARVDKNHATSVSGGFTVSRRSEATAAAASKGEWEQIHLIASGLFGLAFITEELLVDSIESFSAIVARAFNDEFTSKLIDERLNGTGAGGQYLGINNSPAMITVAKETSQLAETIVAENLYKMRARCWRYDQAVWLANHDCIPQLFALNSGITDAPKLLQTLGSDIPDLLLGRPLIFTEYTETIGTQGDLILANWSQYLEGIYQPIQSAESMHVRFVEHERALKFWTRNAGAPWWKTALTPKKSADTLSPFVRLATRA